MIEDKLSQTFDKMEQFLASEREKWQAEQERIAKQGSQFNWSKLEKETQDYSLELHHIRYEIAEALQTKGFKIIWKTHDSDQVYTNATEWQRLNKDGFPLWAKRTVEYVEELLSIQHQFNTKTFIAYFHRRPGLKLAPHLLSLKPKKWQDQIGTWILYYTMEDNPVETKFDTTRLKKDLQKFPFLILEWQKQISGLLKHQDLEIEWIDDHFANQYQYFTNWQNYNKEGKPTDSKVPHEYVNELIESIKNCESIIRFQAAFRFVRSRLHNEGDWLLCWNVQK
jgi:hypothetical protein